MTIGNVLVDQASSSMSARVELVTVELAREWLQRPHPRQRPVIWSRVRRYAAQMVRGDWAVTHEGAAFDVDGWLIDGQNRLQAVVLAERAVPMLVFLDCPRGSYEHIGQGLPRRLQHVMGLDWVTARTVAAARSAIDGVAGPSSTNRPTPEQEAAFIRNNEQALRTSATWVPRDVAPVAGVLMRAYYHEAHATCARFGEVLRKGITEGKHEAAAVKLRDWLHEQRTGSYAWRTEAYRLTQWALRSFARADGVAAPRPITDDLYPLPDGKRLEDV